MAQAFRRLGLAVTMVDIGPMFPLATTGRVASCARALSVTAWPSAILQR
ncbi:MAG: hypothetical protein R3D03_13360 [Geminicoccaceae bacterium]